MKRFLTMIAVISVALVAMAQTSLATLSHNGQLTLFSGEWSFGEALEAAENGDYIYLSEGQFSWNNVSGRLTKRVSIVGCGYNTVLYGIGDFEVDMTDNPNSHMDAPLFDGLRIDGYLQFAYNMESKENLERVSIHNISIDGLITSYGGTELIIDKCKIKRLVSENTTGNNVVINNSKIGNLYSVLTEDEFEISVINCNINDAEYLPRFIRNSIIIPYQNSYLRANGTHVIQNSLVTKNISDRSEVSLDNCYIIEEGQEDSVLDENLEAKIPLTDYIGDDGTEIGIYGGNNPFTEFPSVPTVDSSNSKVDYNPENNQLNISIKISDN